MLQLRRRSTRRRRRTSYAEPVPIMAFSRFARFILLSLSSRAIRRENRASVAHPSKRSKRVEPSNRIQSGINHELGDDEDEAGEEELRWDDQQIETVQADFAFFDPKQRDFHGVKLLLQKYPGMVNPWDLSGLVDLILKQTTVGTVVKMADDDNEENGGDEGDDDGLFAVITALNLGRYAEHKCIKEIKEFLLTSCSDVKLKQKVKFLLEKQASDVGLLISQRFVNCPYELVPKLYEALFDEVSWATEDEPTPELRKSFCFKYYLLISRVYENKSKNRRKAEVKLEQDDDAIIYIQEEDEIFHELSSWSFTFPVPAEQPELRDMKGYKEMGLVMAVQSEHVPKFRQKLETLVASEA